MRRTLAEIMSTNVVKHFPYTSVARKMGPSPGPLFGTESNIVRPKTRGRRLALE
ncbi:hypothetical protein KIPB_014509, partial [Kipferlia bialata]|eukprot:g14509.t1